ncbi:unnamed protein product [Phyllotreta striolata]|uniref:Uncharacterized protein n=1 Tax=Phyllotreta striolata TaxID=444603 RepID=A0A9N9TVN6_PHYSR|nr:unnamed protein product [Phyllotreta striolata]
MNKQLLVLSAFVLVVSCDRLDNRYLPPGPKNDNVDFIQPPVDTGSHFNQPKEQISQTSNQFDRFAQKVDPSRQYLSPFNQPKEQDRQTSNQFDRFAQQPKVEPSRQYLSPFNQPKEQDRQTSNQFDRFTQQPKVDPSRQYLAPFNQPKEQVSQTSNQFDRFSQKQVDPSRQYLAPFKQQEQTEQPSNRFGQVYQPDRQYLSPSSVPKEPISQTSNQFDRFRQPKPEPTRQYLAPFKQQEPTEQPSNRFGQVYQPDSRYQNEQIGQTSNQFDRFSQSGEKPNTDRIIQKELNPDSGDGHYNYSFETENGIKAQEEGSLTEHGPSAQGRYSYTSPEGEEITVEYTADANGFLPKGTHLPNMEAILKSIELNKAALARGEYNEGSYVDEDHSKWQKPLPSREQSPSASEGVKQVFQNNGYQYPSAKEPSAFPTVNNKQVAPLGPNGGSSGYQYPSAREPSAFPTVNNKQVTSFKPAESVRTNGYQKPSGYQYSKPSGGVEGQQETSSSNNNQQRFGTLQDDQGGYKY